jgi:hypothetical protein
VGRCACHLSCLQIKINKERNRGAQQKETTKNQKEIIKKEEKNASKKQIKQKR